ncbi:MAG: hypothetical protein INR66_13970 [Gordonia polyisoprenivorans]|nr:hypothetical protein [Gordonia polyisoprenivorans]
MRDELVTRWECLNDLLVADPTKPIPAVQLMADGSRRAVDKGTPAELMARGEAAGAGTSPWAVVSPIRPEIQVVDVDRCADRVQAPILDAAERVGATLAHLAASGSPHSVHIGVTLPTQAARVEFVRAVEQIREWAGETTRTVALFTPTQGLRLPGSAPLKPTGGVCWPIDVDGRRMTAVAAAARLDHALDRDCVDVGVPLPSPTTDSAALASPDDDVDAASPATLAVVPPRAYRPLPRMTQEQYKVLSRERDPKEGDRSSAALAGGWVLWRLGIRSWRAAAHYYARYECFGKWREREAEERAKGLHLRPGWVSPGQRQWQRDIVRTARTHRPAGAARHDAQITASLREVAQWDAPDLVAAAVAVIRGRFADGYGLTRPVAVRDLASWLALSETTAWRRLHALEERGLLTLAKPYDRDTAPHEARVWTLTTPHPIYRSTVKHDLTTGGLQNLLHPTWISLGQAARLVHSHLSTTPMPSTALSTVTGFPPGSSRHGLGLILRRLEEHGLAVRTGAGRATAWTLGPADLDEAPAADQGRAARQDVQAHVILDRDVWHARGHKTAATAAARRRRARLRTPSTRPQHAGRSSNGAPQLRLIYSDATAAIGGPPRPITSPRTRSGRGALRRHDPPDL